MRSTPTAIAVAPARTLSSTARFIESDVVFLGRGNVTGQVETGAGLLVPGAEVTLNSQSVFGGSQTSNTDGAGGLQFDDVFVGPFSVWARDPATGLGGFASSSIGFDGDVADILITLTPAGSLLGTIFESDGATPVEGAVVRLSPSGRGATTAADGTYRFDGLPLGSYTINVESPANGDRGRGAAMLTVAGDDVTADINLNGLGAVNVTVVDFDGTPVPGAQVDVISQTIFGGFSQGVTDGSGVALFHRYSGRQLLGDRL